MKPLCRNNGLFQWNARVSGIKNDVRSTINITAFCDTRQDAIVDCCYEAAALGYQYPTVNHMSKISR